MSQKIAIFVKNLATGGAEKQAVLLAKALTDTYEVHFIIFNGLKIHGQYLNVLREANQIKVKYFTGNHIQRFRSFKQYLEAENIEMIFSYLTAANLYANLAGRMLKIKVCIGLRNTRLSVGRMLVDRWLTNHWAELAIANSYSGYEYFVQHGFRKGKIVVIPNCYEHIGKYEEKTHRNEVRIVTVARFIRQKDYKTAIRTISMVRQTYDNIRYNIVGYGKQEKHIRKWIIEYRIQDITKVFINPRNVLEILKNSDIYLSTSLFEGTSNAIMEGMDANLPIVCTDVGDNCKLVDTSNGFLCKIRDIGTLSASLIKLVGNAELREKMGKRSKQILNDNYSKRVFLRNYEQVLFRYFDSNNQKNT